MKRNFKMKSLIFTLIILMAVVIVPNVKAAENEPPRYTNLTPYDEADVLFSLNADKTTVKPGDVVSVTLTLDDWRTEYGVLALSGRIYYNHEQLTFNRKYSDLMEEDIYDVTVGPVGEFLGIRDYSAVVVAPEDGYDDKFNTISFAMIAGSPEAYTRNSLKGKSVFTMYFTVNEGVTGPIDIYLKSADKGQDGFNTAVAIKEGDLMGVNTRTTFYVSSNLNELISQ